MKAIIWQAFDLSMHMYSYATFLRRPCLAFLDTTIHCMRVFVWLQIRGLFWGFITCFFSPLVLSLEETLGGQELKGVAVLGNELASVFFFKERLLFESIIR